MFCFIEYYIFGAGKDLTEHEVQKILEQVERTYPEGSDVVMTLAEHYMEKGKEAGLLEGLSEGIKLGEVGALERTVLQLLGKRFGKIPEELRKDISDSDLKTLESVIENILEYEKIEDVRKFVN